MRRRGSAQAQVLLLTGLALLLPAAGCRPAHRPPNLIVILVDTLRADHLGVYGFPGPVSPNLDRLASESFVFERCFAQSPWTKPSVATLFTSLDPQVHGLTNHEGQYWGEGSLELKTGILSSEASTLAESLSAAGWDTAAFVSNPWVVADYGFAQGFDVFDAERTELDTPGFVLTFKAEAWLAQRSPERPFFLYLHFMDVHAPYDATRWDFDALTRVQGRRRLADDDVPTRRWRNFEVAASWATDEMRHGLSYWRRRYASGVRAFDRRIGRFIDDLRESGILDRSWLVVTSDHGEELFEHGDWSHGQSLFDHQLRVPLLVRDPEGRGNGTRVPGIVELIDVMPTLLSLAGVESPEAAQGRDVSPLFRGDEPDGLPGTLATATQRDPGLYSMRTERYKLIDDVVSGKSSLYDLVSDPEEQSDVAAEQPDKVADLRDRLRRRIAASLAAGALDPESRAIPSELEERLRGLGYLD